MQNTNVAVEIDRIQSRNQPLVLALAFARSLVYDSPWTTCSAFNGLYVHLSSYKSCQICISEEESQ